MLTGFIVSDEDEAVAATRRLHELDRATVWQPSSGNGPLAAWPRTPCRTLSVSGCPSLAVARGSKLSHPLLARNRWVFPSSIWYRAPSVFPWPTVIGADGLVSLVLPANVSATFHVGRTAVHSLNFFVAAMQTGFGPFMSVWLVSQGWSLTDVGVALSIGTVAGLVGQLPGGGLVDRMHRKRPIAAIAIAVVAVSALMIALTPSIPAVWLAQILHAIGSVIITPAIAALTLALCGPDSFSERLGGNARYAALGAALAAGAFGLASTRLGEQSIFIITLLWRCRRLRRCFRSVRAPPRPRRRSTWRLRTQKIVTPRPGRSSATRRCTSSRHA